MGRQSPADHAWVRAHTPAQRTRGRNRGPRKEAGQPQGPRSSASGTPWALISQAGGQLRVQSASNLSLGREQTGLAHGRTSMSWVRELGRLPLRVWPSQGPTFDYNLV